MIVQGLELDLDRRVRHDLVELAVLLPTNELAVLISKLKLKTDLCLESLRIQVTHQQRGRML